MNEEDLEIEFLTTRFNLDRVSEFTCGNTFISDYIRTGKAINDRRTGDTITILFIHKLTDRIVAFASLKCSSLWVDQESSIYVYPTTEVVMFAVDVPFQRRGIGQKAFHTVISHIMNLRDKMGIKAITLFSTPASVAFYEKHFNFIELTEDMDMYKHEDVETSMPMFFILPEIEG